LLVRAGVPVLHKRFAGQMHGFFTMVGELPGAGAAMDFVVAGIDELLKRKQEQQRENG
jgi:acetyl esterase